jgi:hypothetical protein
MLAFDAGPPRAAATPPLKQPIPATRIVPTSKPAEPYLSAC